MAPGLNVCNGPEGHAIGRPQGQLVGDSSGSLLFIGPLVRDGADLIPQRQQRVRAAAWHLERSDPTCYSSDLSSPGKPANKPLAARALEPYAY